MFRSSHLPLAGPTLLLARGSSAKPTFEQVPISLETEGGEAAQIVLKAADGGVLLGSGMEVEDAAGPAANGIAEAADAKAKRKQKKLQATQNDVTVLGANNMGEPVAMRAVGAEAAASRKRPGQAQEGDEQEAVEAEMAEADGEFKLGFTSCLPCFTPVSAGCPTCCSRPPRTALSLPACTHTMPCLPRRSCHKRFTALQASACPGGPPCGALGVWWGRLEQYRAVTASGGAPTPRWSP